MNDKKDNKRLHWRGLLFFLVGLFLLTGCQDKQNNEATTHTLPKIESKYDTETIAAFTSRVNQGDATRYENLVIPDSPILTQPDNLPQSLFYDSGIHIAYPSDGVRGLYITAENVADEAHFDQLIDFINKTDLNAVVLDFKDDHGNIISVNDSDNEDIQTNTLGNIDYKKTLKKLEENNIYPIARIVTFKDNVMSDLHPELSFHDSKHEGVWADPNGSQFINPFLFQTWDYNTQVAIEAAKMGFKEIQFDYIRFPEGFNEFADELDYDYGDYANYLNDNKEDEGAERVYAINDFLTYAREKLIPYGVDVSADIFGYTAVANDAADVRGIGQDFTGMAERVDVISSMIYPSHWGPVFFGIISPDLYPYDVVDAYMTHEHKILSKLHNKVTSRPWLQDFTLDTLPVGTYKVYGVNEVQDQINALKKHGIHEFLLWNASGIYTEGVKYLTNSDQPVEGPDQYNTNSERDLFGPTAPSEETNPNSIEGQNPQIAPIQQYDPITGVPLN